MSSADRTLVTAALLLAAALAAGTPETAAGQKPTLTPTDYGAWERLGAFELDPTGTWLAASITRVDGTREVRLRRTDADGASLVLEHASGPAFGRDGRWLAYAKGVHPDEAEASEEPISDRLGLVDLGAGTDSVLFDVARFAFRDDGRWLAALGAAPSDSVGAELIVLNPSTGSQTLVGSVADFAWQDGGPLLAATLRTAAGTANGVVLFDPDAGTLRTLEARDADYRALTWADESSRLAVMRSQPAADDDAEETHDLLVWADAASTAAPRVLEGRGRSDIADTLRVTEYAGIGFADDGGTVFFGVRPWDEPPIDDAAGDDGGNVSEGGAGGAAENDAEPGDAPAGEEGAEGDEDDDPGPADVQVWHWSDDQILRAQEWRATQISRETLLAAWHLADDRVVVLGRELDEPVSIVADGRWGVVADYDPFHVERRFGAGTASWYRVDVRSGAREIFAEAVEERPLTHDDGSWALVYAADAWSSVDLSTLERRPVAAGRSFTRSLSDHDYPGPRPSWGLAGWIEGEDAVLLYDEHDVWRAGLANGSARRLTDGAESGLRYRAVNLDPDGSRFAPPVLKPGEPTWLSVFDPRTKESGYATLAPDGAVREAVFEEARVGGLTKARDADRYALRMERWDDSPDVFVGGDGLRGLRQVTETNPFQADFAWGRAELLDYTTDAGHDLQAILVYPAGFEEGRTYPLILYQYERLSDNLHAYAVPSERTYYDYQTWSQRGYFVLMPDIVYEPGRPGPSALDAVEHALDAAVATGHVDPGRMGLIGHSWGGYQASYLPTRTHRFAASVAGAAITNFLSFMGAVHWNGGLPETGHWETGQARMAVPYWEDLEGHLESSPANFIADLDTPMLLMHGDADGVVDFYQGMEFYNYARRAGKEVVLLVYPGADHGLRQEAQQVDYHRRILEWFGHYLKGEPAAEWITRGETWAEREKRIGG